MNMQRKLITLWTFQFLAFVAVFVYLLINKPLEINTDLSHLFQNTGYSQDISDIISAYGQENESRNLLLVSSRSIDEAVEQAKSLAVWLDNQVEVQSSQSAFNTPSTKDIVDFYSDYKYHLLSEHYKTLLANPDKLFQHQLGLVTQLSSPFVSASMALDPSLSLADYLTSQIVSSNMASYKDHLYINKGKEHYVLVTFNTVNSGLALKHSAEFVKRLKQQLIQTNTQALFLGQVFYAEFAYQSAQFEMRLFSLLSAIGIGLLIFFAYRSFVSFLFTTSIISISLFYGYLAMSILYNQVHILSFVFAVMLIGIAADYCFHIITSLQSAHSKAQQTKALGNILRPLVMGLVSTVTGYVMLLMSPFPLFSQVTVFVVFGLISALISAIVLGPVFIRANSLNIKGANLFSVSFVSAGIFKNSVVFMALIFVCYSAFNLNFSDDVRHYYQASDEIQTNQEQVSKLLDATSDFQFYVVSGEGEQQVLTKERALTRQLDVQKAQGNLQRYNAISTWVPTIREQQASLAQMSDAIERGAMKPFEKVTGLKPSEVATESEFLTVAKWLASPMGLQYHQQWFEKQNNVSSVVRLKGVVDSIALAKLCEGNDLCTYVDRAQSSSEQLALFRDELIYYLAMSLLIVLIILSKVYGVLKAIKIVVICIASILFALGASQVFQGHVNIFNVMACVLVIALGLDYSIFYADQGKSRKLNFTIFISAMSSIIVFAVLALSNTPAIKSFGITIFLGIIAVFFLAPLSDNNNKDYNENNSM